MSKKVLYISYDGMTDPLGQSQVIPYLEGLSELGHRIIIVSAEKYDRLSPEAKALRKHFVQQELGWFPISYSNTIPVWSQYATFRRLLKSCVALQEEHHFDIVHCRSYIPSLVGLELKNRYGTKFIFDMRGFWADERVEGKIWNVKNPVYRKAYQFFKRKEKEFLKASDAIVSLTENAKQEIISWKELDVKSLKVKVIPCCADLHLFSGQRIDPSEQQILKNRLGIADKEFVIGYSGSIGTWYLLEEMLKFFKCLLLMEPRSTFLFITPGSPQLILHHAAALGVGEEKIKVVSAARERMPLFLSICDAGIFFIKNSWSKKASSPTKLGEWMAMGKPVVCNSGIGDIDQLMREPDAGVLLNSFDEESYKAAVWRLLENSASAEKIRGLAENFFSLEDGVKRYHSIYSGL